MKKVAIIHGTGGSPEGNWFPWLASELQTLGLEVIVPRMPTPENQSLQTWLAAFEEQVGTIDQTTTVIGHSIGAVCLLRILEQAASPIGCSVFVAGLTGRIGIPEFDFLNATFVERPFKWETIRQNAGLVICLSGDNDPYVPLAQGLEIAKNLHVTPTLVKGGGHLNAGSGYLTFPLLLEMLTSSQI
jgi:predicted alpha/beta hydrolase family esterase